MLKRFHFKCWSCERTYTLFCEITDQQKLRVACPFCKEDGVVDLAPYLKDIKIVLRRWTIEDLEQDYQLPEVLPTSKPE